jgi:ribonucleoside-diphosphate reductase alpha chain
MIPEDIKEKFLELSYEERVNLISQALANISRPNDVDTKTKCIQTGCGKAYITFSVDPAFPHELFCLLGKTGGCAAAWMEALSRIITEAMKAGVPKNNIIRHLKGIQCPNSGGEFNLSCPEAIARVLEDES